jgi:two-component system CheB/CheR fusion protein
MSSTDTSPQDTSDAPGKPDPDADPSLVVGVGASADGLEALQGLFEALPDRTGMAFLVVQHLAPDHDSKLAGLLQSATDMRVEQAADETPIRDDHVYVVPPARRIEARGGSVRVRELPPVEGARQTVDFVLRSIAEEYEQRAVGVVLSGAGTDGTTGLRVIRRNGGVTMAQDPAEAGVDQMPRHAAGAEVTDIVAPVARLAERLACLPDAHHFDRYAPPGELDQQTFESMNRIVSRVREETEADFSEYKRPMILRRVRRRMQLLELASLEEYEDYIADHPEELDELVGELLVGVTRFFRNPEAWERLDREVLSELFDRKSADEQIRIWVPGCATGEEVYTVGLLAGRRADRMREHPEVKIFGTDVDEQAVSHARDGAYPPTIAADVPRDLLEEYFRLRNDRYEIGTSIRQRVMFATHDILDDPPFADLDVVTCRNLLIYLRPEAQQRLLEILHHALEPGGVLMTGASESPHQADQLFEAIDSEYGLYRMQSDHQPGLPGRGAVFGFDPEHLEPADLEISTAGEDRDLETLHREALLAKYEPASVLVDEDFRLLHVLGDVGPYLSLRPGKTTGSLLEMASEELRPHLRSILLETLRTAEPLEHRVDVGETPLTLDTRPVDDRLVEVSFEPAPAPPSGGETGEGAESEEAEAVDQLERELEETRRRLQSTIEEYETTNAKLRASNEELVSMNEALQSTSEELETSKQELQSMNEELTTVNEELNDKIDRLNAANSDLRNLLRSAEIGTLFLDRELRIKRFTEPVTDYINVMESDQGRPVQHLTHSLDYDWLAEDARRAIDEEMTLEREVADDGGRHLLVRVLPYLNFDDQIDGAVLTFIDITRRKEVERRLAASEEKFRSVFECAADAIFVYPVDDGEPKSFTDVNQAAIEQLDVSEDRLGEMTVDEVVGGPNFELEEHLERLRDEGYASVEALLEPPGGADPIPVDIHARTMPLDNCLFVVEAMRNITDRKRYQQALVGKNRAEKEAKMRSMFMSTLDHEIRSPLATIQTLAELLRRKVGDKVGDLPERIERTVDQILKILDSILRMARLDADEAAARPETFDLGEHVGDLVETHRPLAECVGLELTYRPPDSPVDVELDPRFIAQILNNLVDNAIKFTEEGRIEVSVSATDEQIDIEVADTGCGIPKDRQEAIFQREVSERSDPDEFHGAGLGLAISRQLTEAMDGELFVESTPGEGSTFRLALPLRLSEE